MKGIINKILSGRGIVLAIIACLASNAWATLAVGDTVPGLSNTGTAGTISKYSECCFSFCIPATSDLPEGAIVKVKKIKFAEVATHGTNENNPYYLALNTCKSDAVVVDSSNKIQANDSTSCNTLIYTFTEKDCLIKVGTTYTQLGAESEYNSQRFDAGKGLTFLHSNGNRWSSGTTMQCAVTYVNTSDANSVIASTSSSGAGYYPVYEIEAEVVTADPLAPDFEYNATVGSVSVTTASANWVGDLTNKETNRCRIGPSGAGLVYDMGGTSTPYGNMSAKSGQFSFAVYADVAQVPSTGKKRVLVSFSKKNYTKLVLYREGDNLKFGLFDNQNAGIGAHATLPVPSAGFHLIAGVCDLSTATVSLYVDSSSDTQSQGSSYTLSNGFQLSAIYENDTAYDKGENFALSKFMGYDRALTAEEIATLSSRYPATDGTEITADINPSISDKTLTVYSSEATGSQYLGITAGTLTIPANNTVTVPQMRVMNAGAVTVNINGTVEIDSSMDSLPATGEAFISGYKGILLGGADAAVKGTYNITGTIDASDAYLWGAYAGDDQTININGGRVSVKGLYDGGKYVTSYAKVYLTNGGTLEVGELLPGTDYRSQFYFGNGTYKVLSSGTDTRVIQFEAGENEYTTLDPSGCILTLPSYANISVGSANYSKTAIKGSGDIKVASSVSGGKVKFNSLTTDYTGNITVAANATMELVAGAYAGTITVEAGGTLEINPGASVDYTCNATLAGAGSVVIKSGTVTLANAPTVTSAISVGAGAVLKLPTGTISGVSGSGTLEIPNGVEVTVTENTAITVGSLKGPGSLILSGKGPGASNTTLKGLLQNGNWNGTFALVHVDDDNSNGLKGFNFHEWGNSGSKLRLTGVNGYLSRENTAEQIAAQPEVVLENGTGDYAYGFRSDDGYSYTISGNASSTSYTIIRKLSGSGTLKDNCNPSQLYVFNDASGFAGSIIQSGRASPWGKTYVFSPGATPSALPGQASGTTFDGDKATAGTINVLSGSSISIGDNESWQTQNGIRIAGNVELKGTATLSSATMLEGGATLKFKNLGASESPKYLTCSSTLTLPTSGTVTLNLDDVTIPAAGATLISASSLISSDAAKFNPSKGVVRVENGALMVYPVAAEVTWSDDSVTPYATVGAALTAIAGNSNYKYVTAYVSETVEYYSASILKMKTVGQGVEVTLRFPGSAGDYGWIGGEPDEDGIVTYSPSASPTTYTWGGGASGNWWTSTNWKFGDNYSANRPPQNGDVLIISTAAEIAVAGNQTVSSITASAAVTFTASTAATITASTGGIVLSAAGASITVDGVTLSPAPSTTVDGYYVKRTGTTTYTYTAVQKVASAVINEETVYFDDIDDAFAEITADHSVTVTIINGEGDYDDYDDTIAELGFFREGANVKFLAAERRNINGSLIAQYSSAQEAIDADDGQTIICICAEATVSARVTRPMFIKPVGILLDDITINCYLAGYSYVKPDSDLSPTYPGVYQINAQASAATFTWNSSVASGNWDTIGNWVSEDGEVGFVPNNSAWDVVLNTDATITMGNSRTVGHLSVGAAVDIRSSDNKELTLTDTDGVELTSASASITLTRQGGSGATKVNLTSTPYTSLEGMYVKTSDPTGSATVYEVAAKVASVTDSGSNVTYYDSLATAVSSASTGDSIALFANSSEAITLNDKTINFSEGSYTFTGTFTGNGTVVLGAALKSASSARWPAGWTGTVELKNVATAIPDFTFNHYGNANSTVRMNNVEVKEVEGSIGDVGCIDIASGGLIFNAYWPNNKTFTIAANITGSGTIKVAACCNNVVDGGLAYYVFTGDLSGFSGSMLAQCYNSPTYNSIIVIKGAGDATPTATGYGQMFITEHANVNVGASATWTATTLTVDGTMNVANGGAISGTIAGSGTVTYNGSVTAPTLAAGWTGTVELKDITTVINNFNFANYGTANSTVKMNNVDIHMPSTGGAYGNVGTIEVADGDLRFAKSNNNADSIAGQTFTFAAAITGTGKIRVGTRCQTDNSAMSFYIFTGDLSGFTGGVDFNDTGWYKPTIVFKTVGDTTPQRDTNEWGEILVSENRTIKLGKEMYAPAGIVLAGAINVLESGSVRVDTSAGKQIRGSGTITYAAFPESAPALNASWAGTISLPAWTTSAAFDINAYGKAGSTIELAGMSSGWIKPPATGTVAITPNLKLTGTMSLANCSDRDYSFQEISGNGTLSVSSTALNSVSITKISAGYTGTISNTSGKNLTITTLAREAGTSTASGTKLLATSGADIAVTGVTIGGATQELTLYYADDGVYVDGTVEATTTGEGSEAVTTIETAGNVTSVTVDLDNAYSGKIALPGNVTRLTVTGPTITASQLRLVTTQGSTYDNLLSYSAGTVSLDPSAFYQNGEGEANKIYVEPKTAASDPMTMPGATTAPSFSIKTIPGLYYVVRSGTDPSSLTAGDATQATTTTTGLAGPALGNEDTVRYYKISVGRTAAEAAEAAQ